jgi:hypothetical protein
VTKADAPIPEGASEGDCRITRSRPADDVNAQVREAIAEAPAASPAESHQPWITSTLDHVAESLQKSRSRFVNLFRSDLTEIRGVT